MEMLSILQYFITATVSACRSADLLMIFLENPIVFCGHTVNTMFFIYIYIL